MEILDRSEDALAAIGIDYEKYKDRTNKTFIKLQLDKSLIGETSNNISTFEDEPDF
jgi:hypothetical protein